MSRAQNSAGARARREAPEVIEPGRPERTLAGLLVVRDLRQQRLRRELRTALLAWRASRAELCGQKLRLRAAVAAAQAHWIEARAAFFSMQTGSGQFQDAKRRYARMRREADAMRLTWRDMLRACVRQRLHWLGARQALRLANLRHEKLRLLREEVLRANPVLDY